MKQPGPCTPLLRSVVTVALVLGCGRETAAPDDGGVTDVVIDPATATVAVGASVPLSAIVLDYNGEPIDDRPVYWAAENASIIDVSADGVVTGVRIGVTQVAASAGGQSAMAAITVVQAGVASLQLSPSNLSLFLGQSTRLAAEAFDGSGNLLKGRHVTWSSNNPSVAIVNSRGLVTARGIGGAIITATSEGNSALASVTVSIIPIALVVR
jgi:uncharacterized protein YjdB